MKTNWNFRLPRPHDEADVNASIEYLDGREALRLVPIRVAAPWSFLASRRSQLRLRCDDREARLLMELL